MTKNCHQWCQIGWTHNVVILTRCNDDAEREFYLRMTRRHGWSKNVLIHQIENRTYEKTVRSQTKFDHTLPAEIGPLAKLAIKKCAVRSGGSCHRLLRERNHVQEVE